MLLERYFNPLQDRFVVSSNNLRHSLEVMLKSPAQLSHTCKETMAVDNLPELLHRLNFDAEYLLFDPAKDHNERFDDVPRYLFRVSAPSSQGITDKSWVKSKDARDATADSSIDIFSRPDERLTADMIYRHLRGWEGPDNLVSWTSSLLFALVYIFHLRAKKTSIRATFAKIYLCVVDTSRFPKGVFLRDLDLIRAFRAADQNLQSFENLRCRQRQGFSGYFYFGEYLSQGSLKIEGRCQIVSAQSIIDQGLCDIRSEFQEYADREPVPWPPLANTVVEMRESFYRDNAEREKMSAAKLSAALAIAQLFGPGWKLPMAAQLVALTAPQIDDDNTMLAVFRHKIFTGEYFV